MNPKTDMEITKWNEFCLNYPHDFIEQVANQKGGPTWGCSVEHLQHKFESWYNRAGMYGVMPGFYSELDLNNRRALVHWVNTQWKR